MEFRGRQVQQLFVQGHMATRRIQRQGATLEHRCTDASWSALKGAHPRDELTEVKRFDEVVIRTRIEALDSVRRSIARGQHQDGGRAVIAPRPGCDLHARHARHSPVENRDVVLVELQLLDRIVPTVDRVDVIAGIFKTLYEDLPQTTIVLRDQDSHR